MKKVLLSAVMFVGITATAQDYEKRVGVNTETPRASLEVKAINNGTAQGILFPHISETEKARWAKDNDKGLVAGTVIWNTTKICLDYFDGTNWQCTDGTKPNVHPTPWTSTPTPPPVTTYTGTAIWGDTAGETITATKNNCPTGQSGSSVTYPANNTQHITYTATSTVSQAEANQKALDLMNSSTEVAKRQQLAQDYANANGMCFDRTAFRCDGFNDHGDLSYMKLMPDGREQKTYVAKSDLENVMFEEAKKRMVREINYTDKAVESWHWAPLPRICSPGMNCPELYPYVVYSDCSSWTDGTCSPYPPVERTKRCYFR